MQVAFYEGAEPRYVAPRLVEKMYAQKQRGVLLIHDTHTYQDINDVLWTFSKVSFIPHGGKEDGLAPEDQPFWLTSTLENPNHANVLILLGENIDTLDKVKSLGFDRVVSIFIQPHQGAIDQYASYQSAGASVQWWVNTTGGWQNKANLPAAA